MGQLRAGGTERMFSIDELLRLIHSLVHSILQVGKDNHKLTSITPSILHFSL